MKLLSVLTVAACLLLAPCVSHASYALSKTTEEAVYGIARNSLPETGTRAETLAAFIKAAPPAVIIQVIQALPEADRVSAALEILALRGAIAATNILEFQHIFSKCPIADAVLLRAIQYEEDVSGIAFALSQGETRVVGKSIVLNAKIVDKYTGISKRHVDVLPTLERIEAGTLPAHSNDGWKIFYNMEKKLPVKPSGYYREYRHLTEGIAGRPGPQRIVTGKNGEKYYTGDHYDTFISLN